MSVSLSLLRVNTTDVCLISQPSSEKNEEKSQKLQVMRCLPGSLCLFIRRWVRSPPEEVYFLLNGWVTWPCLAAREAENIKVRFPFSP